MRLVAPVILAVCAPAAAWAQAEEIVPGATYEELAPGDIPARVHLVTLDLTATELSFDATASAERGQTTSAFAGAAGAAVAVNGGPFSPLDFSPYGLAAGGGAPWPDSDAATAAGALLIERAGPRTEARLARSGDPPSAGAVEALDAAIAGGPLLVQGGAPRGDFDCDDRQAIPCERAPRTAAALAEGGTRLWLAVVDGWHPDSEGATAAELASLLADRGADEALLLDGGSASSLFAEPLGGLINAPSDGAERRVANHLAVSFDELEAGEMTVLVRERDVDDPDADLAGVTVTLDDGQEATTGANGQTGALSVRPRLVCATAELAGYAPATECLQVPPGLPVLNRIALFPEGEGSGATGGRSAPGASRPGSGDPTAGGCHAAPGRLHGGAFRVTLGPLLAAAFLAAAARRRELSLRRRHCR